jgi:ribosomal protein L2
LLAERQKVTERVVDFDDRQDRAGAKVERLGQLDPRRDRALAAVPARDGKLGERQRPDERGDRREGRQILIITCLTTV